jgi:hypothetical protein
MKGRDNELGADPQGHEQPQNIQREKKEQENMKVKLNFGWSKGISRS